MGWTRDACVKVEGTTYPLGPARFLPARDVSWCWSNGLGMSGSALPPARRTLALYPFEWRLEVEFELEASSLATRLTVRNTGMRPMPYACGLHPGFRWPFAGGDLDEYEIVFAERERASVPIISPQGLFTHQVRRVPLDGRRLPLSAPLLEAEALCFLDARSTSLRFAHRSGASIAVTLEDFPHIALWSRPTGRFLSIEAWTGHGDYVDADGDLFTKASMRHLPPGASAAHGATYAYDRSQTILPTDS